MVAPTNGSSISSQSQATGYEVNASTYQPSSVSNEEISSFKLQEHDPKSIEKSLSTLAQISHYLDQIVASLKQWCRAFGNQISLGGLTVGSRHVEMQKMALTRDEAMRKTEKLTVNIEAHQKKLKELEKFYQLQRKLYQSQINDLHAVRKYDFLPTVHLNPLPENVMQDRTMEELAIDIRDQKAKIKELGKFYQSQGRHDPLKEALYQLQHTLNDWKKTIDQLNHQTKALQSLKDRFLFG